MAPRRALGLPLLLAAALAALEAGCTSAPQETGRGAESETARPAARVAYRPLAAERLASILKATDFELTRCGYRVSGRWYTLDTRVPLGELSSGCRDEFTRILSRLDEVDRDDQPLAPEDAVHAYQLTVRETWILDVRITASSADGSIDRPLTVRVLSHPHLPPLTVAAPHLGAQLEAQALATLLRSSERPRWALAWHAPALARFLRPPGALTSDSAARLRHERLFRRLIDRLLSLPGGSEASQLVARLIPSVDWLTPGDIARLVTADAIVVRVLPLTRLALAGDAAALSEIYRLALEHAGDAGAFVAAARRLFPGDLNPILVARHPPQRDGDDAALFLATIRRHLGAAEYSPARAWRLPLE